MVISGLVSLVFLPLAIIIVGAAALLAGRRRARSLAFDETIYPGLRSLRRATIRYRGIGLAVGGVAGVAALAWGHLRPLTFAAPLLAAVVVVAAIVVGQQSAYRAARVTGSAGLERRQLRSYLPPALTRWTVCLLALLLTAVLFSTLAASPDDMGRAGRAVSVWWIEGEGAQSGTYGAARTPFPGSFYTSWVGLALALLLALAVLGLVLTVRRPRNGADPELVRVDDALRRITVEGIVAAVGVGVSGSALAVTLVSGMDLLQLGPVPLATASGAVSLIVAVGALVGLLGSAVVLLVPRDGGGR